MLPLPEALVQSLAREIRFYKLCGMTKGGEKKRKFLMVLEARKSKIKMLPVQFLVRLPS